MFDISCATIALLIAWGAIILVVSQLKSPWALGLRLRLYALTGIVFIAAAFIFQPWVELDFISYIDPTPEFIREMIPPELVDLLIKRVGVEWASKLFETFTQVTALNGFFMHVVPTFGFWTRFWAIVPLLPALVALVWTPIGAFWRGSCVGRAVGGMLVVTSLLSAIGLLLSMPDLDALGISGSFRWGLLAVLAGAHMGNGPWFAVIGLLLLTLGGLVELRDSAELEPAKGDDIWTS